MVVSADVKFNENSFPAADHPCTPTNSQIVDVFPDLLATMSSQDHRDTIQQTDDMTQPQDIETEDTVDEHVEDDAVEDVPVEEPTVRRSTRSTNVPIRYGFISRDVKSDDSDNPTYEMAINGPDKSLWKKAMEAEFEAFTIHNVGTLVDKPPDANVLGGMWIFSRKRDEHHRIIKHKARWVIFGNHQIHGLDFFDTYASVGKSDSLRILLSIAATQGWDIMQFDIVTAFLNGDMKDTVHCRQVRGF